MIINVAFSGDRSRKGLLFYFEFLDPIVVVELNQQMIQILTHWDSYARPQRNTILGKISVDEVGSPSPYLERLP